MILFKSYVYRFIMLTDFLTSYGFRGEGLNAICKVGEVSVLTKTSNDEIMTCYKLDHDGTIVSTEPTHGLNGIK